MAALKKSFGTFEGDAAVWTWAEAWVLTNGVWYKHESFVLLHEAPVMTEGKWTKAFPGILKTLPTKAFTA
jgi:hypothetical protein